MLDIAALGAQIAQKRRERQLRQIDLAKRAGVSRATLDALENGRLGELGFNKVVRLLAALGLDIQFSETSSKRPTLEDLLRENERDKGLDRQR